MKPVIFFVIIIISATSYAQHTISGQVIDKKAIGISGANIFLEGTYDGAVSDATGHFSFSTSEEGQQKLTISALGFDTVVISIDVSVYQNQQILLIPSANTLDTVVLTAGTFETGDKSRVSVLKPLDIVTTAGAAGDIIGALNTLPGTQSVGESGRLFVRGGESDETQTYVDGLRVAQPYGAAANNLPTRGRFSPFLFSGISFSTGGYSAEYGEALSSVLLLSTIDEPDQEKTDVSLMTVGLGVGNTQKWSKNSLSFNAAYLNLAPYQAVIPQDIDWNKPYQTMSGETVYRHKFENGLFKLYAAFDVTQFDLNQKDINYIEKVRAALNNTNLYVNSVYKGYFAGNWQISTGMSYGLSHNKLKMTVDAVENQQNSAHFKLKISKPIFNRMRFTAGGDWFTTHFSETVTPAQESVFQSGYTNTILASFAETDISFSNKLALKAGVRASKIELLNELILSPRVSLAYKLSKYGQLALAYGEFAQTPKQEFIKYAHNLESEKASHYILNYFYQREGKTLRVETYFKQYQDLITYSDEWLVPSTILSNQGDGYAKGLDVFWRDNKSIKNMEYWLSYSYIDSQRDYLNYPEKTTPNFIATHTLSLVGKYWVNSLRSQVGFSYTVNSGRPFNDKNTTDFMNGKTKAYQDLSLNWAYLLSQQKILYLSVSNAMGVKNIFGYQYANTPDANGVFDRQAITPAAPRFVFIGFFWTISDNKKDNQLNKL